MNNSRLSLQDGEQKKKDKPSQGQSNPASAFDPSNSPDFSYFDPHSFQKQGSRIARQNAVMQMQQTHGNQYVLRMLREQQRKTSSAQNSGFSHVLAAIRRMELQWPAGTNPAQRTPMVSAVQREDAPNQSSSESSSGSAPPVTWAKSPTFGAAIELPQDEAARRVNQALDIMGDGLTYVQRPAQSPPLVASASDTNSQQTTSPESSGTSPSVQTFRDGTVQREGGSSPLAKIHGGVVGSIQFCWDCLTGEASFKGWIWAGVGYDAPVVGWVGGYFFGEKTWWSGKLSNLFEPGTCDPNCDPKKEQTGTTGWGIAGFPIDIKPKERARLSKAGVEAGFLLTPNSLCDADFELIVLINLLGYMGPVATILTKAVDGINAVTRNTPHVELEAGIDGSVTLHLCRGANSLLAVNRADLCGGGYIGAGFGLSHTKGENHGVM
ncbi:MAG: hypothetical protein ACYDBJ_27270 [Aggregatilineales bacterium]